MEELKYYNKTNYVMYLTGQVICVQEALMNELCLL